MRKHDVRKWLHAILDLLPVIIIPVFMIYSHRHTIDNYAIEVPQNEVVDFNQLLNIPSLDFTSYGVRFTSNNGVVHIFGEASATNDLDVYFQHPTDLFVSEHVYAFSVDNYEIMKFAVSGPYAEPRNSLWTCTSPNYFYCRVHVVENENYDLDLSYNIFDLTQMFGSGNEPTTFSEFRSFYPNDFYPYEDSHIELLKDVSTITYDDTDIGSQMLYCLYNSVDKYFNLNNVFGFNNVYDWLSLNIFNGNPPIAIYIVWNIALYEFLMDLIMLLYALFMWFIDMCESLIDRSFHVASGRKK